jgi:Uncharacterized membrane protein (homolog of Drosophila rhomboid)
MLSKLSNEIQQLIVLSKHNFLVSGRIIALLWIIHLFNAFSKHGFNQFGIRPRTLEGLVGIFLAPFLHADKTHLFFNTIPLLVLSTLVLTLKDNYFYQATAGIILLSGLLIWVFGRAGTHIGASSLIMGDLGYLLANAYLSLNSVTIMIAAICLYYFGSLIFSIFPSVEKNVSWEGHLLGLISGIAVAYYQPLIKFGVQLLKGFLPW